MDDVKGLLIVYVEKRFNLVYIVIFWGKGLSGIAHILGNAVAKLPFL